MNIHIPTLLQNTESIDLEINKVIAGVSLLTYMSYNTTKTIVPVKS